MPPTATSGSPALSLAIWGQPGFRVSLAAASRHSRLGAVDAILTVTLILFAGGGAHAAPAAAPRIVLQGSANGAPACASCHGVNGEGGGRGAFPRLSAQPTPYLAKQLEDYRSGRRRNAIMEPIARALSADEMLAAANWYAGASAAPTAWPAAGDAASRARGAELARSGQWSRTVPGCESCHGPMGSGVAPSFPALRGQSPDYIQAQFEAFRSGSRANDPLGLMRAFAQRLAPADVQAVAAYFGSLDPAASSDSPSPKPRPRQ